MFFPLVASVDEILDIKGPLRNYFTFFLFQCDTDWSGLSSRRRMNSGVLVRNLITKIASRYVAEILRKCEIITTEAHYPLITDVF